MKLTKLYKEVEVDGKKSIKCCKAMDSQMEIMKKAGWRLNAPEKAADKPVVDKPVVTTPVVKSSADTKVLK